jgi:hypothetical protein
MHDYDTSSKWLIQHHGDSILRLAGVRDITAWTPRQAEPVQPHRLPDGLLEVHRQGRPKPSLFILEISTYPYTRLAKQAADDALLVYLERGVVPGVVAFVLHPRGKQRAAHEIVLESDDGSTRIHVAWKVVELWRIPAAELLAAGDIGLIPWVPLAHFEGPPEPIFRECRDRIERDAPRNEQESLLVATHFLAGLKYNDPKLFQLLGGRKTMIKIVSPVLREIVEEAARKATQKAAREAAREATRKATREITIENLVAFLAARFGADAEAVRSDLKAIKDDARLKGLLRLAATCPDLGAFRNQLPPRKRRRRS